MIQFRTLKISNFLSIGEIGLRLDTPGAFLVTSSAAKRGAFSSNGVGKTSIFESLIWCLFGRTIRELPLDDSIIRNTESVVDVSVSLVVDDKGYMIRRAKKRGKSSTVEILDTAGNRAFTGTVVELNHVIAEQILRSSFEVFCNTVYFPQGRFEFFTQASDKDKKAMFDSILGANQFDDMESAAKAKLKESAAELFDLEHTIDLRRNELGVQEACLKAVRAEELSLKEPEAKPEISVRKLKSQKELLQSNLTDVRNNLDKSRFATGVMSGNIAKFEAQVMSAKMANSRAASFEATLMTKLGAYTSMTKKGTCPTCFQKFVDRESVDAAIAEMTQEAMDFGTEVASALEQVSEASDSLKAAQAALSVEKTAYLELVGERDLLTTKIAGFDETLEAAESVERLIEAQAQLRASIDKRKLEFKAKIAAAMGAIADLEAEVYDAKVAAEYWQFWVEGFGGKGIKSLVFENFLPYVTERANYYSGILTDGSIRISIQPTSELKSGELREKISVTAINQDGASIYQGNSGGERKRIDLCILLALQDLVAANAANDIRLAIFDEVMDEMDDSGMERVVELLKEKGQTTPVFLISHNGALAAHFEDRLELSKTDAVSSLV